MNRGFFHSLNKAVAASFTNLYSFLFDGAGEKAVSVGTVSDFSFIQNTGIFTISLWFKMTDYTDSTQSIRTLMGNTVTGNNKGCWIYYLASTDTIITRIGNGGGAWTIISSTASNYITDNNWHNLVIKGDGTNIFYYLDNSKTTGSSSIGTLSTGDSTNTFNIANSSSSGSATFYGNLDEISIYNVELSDSQITDIYNSGAPNDLASLDSYSDSQLWVRFDSAVWDDSVSNEYDIYNEKTGLMIGVTQSMEEADKVLDVP